MSVVGFDLGNENCFIAVARQGGIEVVANEYTYRQTPAVVSLGAKKRFIGEAGKTAIPTNPKNTVYNFKHLLGRKYNDPFTQAELKRAFYRHTETADGFVGFKLDFQGETKTFTVQQIMGMLLTQLRGTAEMNLKMKVTDCVLSVPSFFTDAQRRALLDAAQIAGLNVLRLLNESTATALAYGFYKTDLPADTEKPRHVVFVDLGESSLQVSAVGFTKSNLNVIASASDPSLGGRTFDLRLLDHFAAEFKTKYKIDVFSSPKATIRLRAECEKLKKVMSAITNEVPLSIECLMDDKDVKSRMSRAEFETLAADLFERIAVPLRKVLADSGLAKEDIFAVEVVGGASRIPAFKNLILEIFGKEASTTLNQDESVSRGCALMCASISPVFRVRDFTVNDITPYGIELSWQNNGENNTSDVFAALHAIPSTKLMTYYRGEAFELSAQYKANQPTLPTVDLAVGRFRVEGVTPEKDGQPSKIKVKVRVNPSGVFNVEAAHRIEEVAGDADVAPMDTSADDDVDTEAPKDKKKKIVKTPLTVVPIVEASLPADKLLLVVEAEHQMIVSDKLEKEREDSRNAVEEFVYEMRDKLDDRYAPYVPPEVKEIFSTELSATESWLYEEGEDQVKKVYVKKLEELKKLSDPFVRRYNEAQERPKAEEALRSSIVLARKAVEQFKAGDEKYNHLDAADVDRVAVAIDAREKFVNEKSAAIAALPLYQDAPITTSQFVLEKDTFDALCTSVFNKAKPKPPAEPMQTESPVPAATEEPMKTD
ncbi:hsp97-like protein [Capsaspora owczarzaki ATCC 30864]|nr:hsp97-like protein [Capsaspora owczarzaki ATCC 30864]|eukprot:XP_004349347.1 hsp97-like protein [Capsaspora owczarzaki ATCC 30864]